MGGVANISMVRADDAEVESKVVRPASWVVFLFLWLIRVQWGDSSVVERWIPDPAVGGSIPSPLIFWLLLVGFSFPQTTPTPASTTNLFRRPTPS